ncbi:outer membrane protein assembly factor BamE [Paraburkholderia caballeronis]|uniref:Outer membrane protein assembly factor BamE n=1 Tax=Paraburkholderia caballeronis TaxID=416943 RepID=A0A1H7I501_9BURK|nr:outer membrane protein assembly factor BamE [Paraburkholderia caballeronis]PXW29255.1 Beta-barrel assembly machine subunit BamE [Paraburkholderia caballeronis]PXX04514.1 Beta-barrel assembly machine subunit BamE [Paraburkholderia caballeronis]RAK05575.1 Beta-barrel assembly machine subunit BamE [Paraburkholderia caballeronis]TDV18353.1 Beta-barrel assembly machine subunit BamE [Paraburkholderia caballeronis]TDV20109.1 Beta-barrel assembly machine subunit BamE [Paraburkholderia caballeronis]
MIPESKTIGQGGRLARTLTGTLLTAALAVVAGCSTYDSLTQRVAQSITPYRITIVQGNFVSKEAAAQMRVGMSRAEVKQLLGTPLLTDLFHANRWDYVFYFKRGSTAVVQQRDFVVNFDGDRVANWTGGEDLPSNLELLAEIDGDRAGRRARAKAAAAASAPVASSAAAAAAGSEAAAAAIGATVPDTARTPSSELGNATAALPVEPNAQAADAANRATNAVQTPTGLTPSVRANTPPSAGLPPNVGTMPQQVQLRRQPPPTPNGPPPNPVGPTAGSQGTGDVTPPAPAQNPSLAAPPAPASAPAN